MIDQDDTVTNADEDTEYNIFFFDFIIQQVDWIDDTTRKSAIEKVNMTHLVNAYTDELLDDTKLNEFYQTLELTEDNYFENHLNIALFNIRRSYNTLRVPEDHWTRVGYVGNVNSEYCSRQNTLCKCI